MKPLVSILIPAYNSQELIAEALRSALAQTWPRIEIIVVDDGSTDNTLSVARRFESKGVFVLTQPNQGAAAARNRAFSQCQGDFIQWLDADDLLHPDKISCQMRDFTQHFSKRTLLSSSWGSFMFRLRRAKFKPTSLWCDLTPLECLLRKMEDNVYMQTGSWLASREIIEAAGPWDTRLLSDDDGEFFCRALLASDGTHFVSDAKAYYRYSGTGSLGNIYGSDKKLEAQWLSMRLHIDYIQRLEDSKRVRAACLQYLQNWLIYFYPQRLDIVKCAKETAKSLGGELEIPSLRWKFNWVKVMFGYSLAWKAQMVLPHAKMRFLQSWDKMLYNIQRSRM